LSIRLDAKWEISAIVLPSNISETDICLDFLNILDIGLVPHATANTGVEQETERNHCRSNAVESVDRTLRKWVGLAAKNDETFAKGTNAAHKTFLLHNSRRMIRLI